MLLLSKVRRSDFDYIRVNQPRHGLWRRVDAAAISPPVIVEEMLVFTDYEPAWPIVMR